MKYIDRDYYVEHHPENDSDVEYLKEHFNMQYSFKFICTAKQVKTIAQLATMDIKEK